MKLTVQAWECPGAPGGVEKVTYRSRRDGREDWALLRPPDRGRFWVVHLHGHGSSGDQPFTRADLRDEWLAHDLRRGYGVLSPNLRGNAWMCPAAVSDLHALLVTVRERHAGAVFALVSGSMGGTGSLIYAAAHPQDVAVVIALCPVTDLGSYHAWCAAHPGGVRDAIRGAIEAAYGGTPEQVPAVYARHSALRRAHRLTMPLFLAHATGDAVIPVEQARQLAHRLHEAPNATYVEIPGGDHDTPLHLPAMLDWLDRQAR